MKTTWVFQRKDAKGYFVGWYEAGRRKSKAFPNKVLAEHFRQVKYTQLNSDVYTGATNTDWYEMVRGYEYSKRAAGLKDTSIYEILLTLRHFVRLIGPCSSKQITQHLLDKFIVERSKEVGRDSLNKDIRNLKTFLNWMRKNRHISEQFEIKQVKTDARLPKVLTVVQANNLLIAAKQESATWYIRTILALTTGLRRGDIERLNIDDIDFETNSIRTYSQKTRKVMATRPMPVDVVPILAGYVNELPPGQIKLFNDTNTHKVWKRICKRVGLSDFCFKDLRATFSSELQKRGISIAVAQRLLEHSSPAVTQRYYTNVEDVLVSAVNQLPIRQWIMQTTAHPEEN